MPSSLYGSKGMAPQGDVIPKGYKEGQIRQFDNNQMDLYKRLFSQVGPDSYLSRLAGGDQEMFDQIEQPALKQFSALQGNIGSRFSGMGQGARNSSGFQNTMNQAGMDFSSQLQSQRQSLQQQAIKDLMGLSGELLGQRPYEKFFVEKKKKDKTPWGQFIGSGLGAIGGAFAGGPGGAMTGAQLGGSFGGMFD